MQTIKCEFTVEELKKLLDWAFETSSPLVFFNCENGALIEEPHNPDYLLISKLERYIESAKPRQHIQSDFVMDMCPPIYTCEVCGETYNDERNSVCEGPQNLKRHNPAPFVFTSNPPQFQCLECQKMYFVSDQYLLSCEGKKNG